MRSAGAGSVWLPDPGVVSASPLVFLRFAARDFRIEHATPNIEQVTGFAVEEVCARSFSWIDRVHEADRDAVREIVERRAGLSDEVDMVFRLRRADARIRWLQVSVSRVADGALEGYLLDVHRVRRALRAGRSAELRRSEQFLESVVENIPDMVFVKDARELRFVRLNRAGEELLGWSRNDLVGRSDFDLFPEEEARFFVEKDREVLETGKLVEIPAERVATRHRGDRTLHTKKIPILGPDGSPAYVLGISEDVTDRVRREELLGERQRQMDAVFEASPDAIAFLTPEGIVEAVSAAAKRITGMTAAERVGQHLLDVAHPEDRPDVEWALRMLSAGSTQDVELSYRVAHRDGRWVPIEVRGRAVRDAEGKVSAIVVVQRDVSAKLAAQAALQAAKSEAERANLAKSEFLSRMSHELRTPLNSIMGFAQLVEMNLGAHPEAENVHYVYRAGRHLLDLINDVLDISRIETGALGLSLETVDVGDGVREACDLVSTQAAERLIRVVSLVEDGTRVRADARRLTQVLLNLLSNAVKFNRDGGEVTVGSRITGGRVIVDVTDTGPGISPDLQSRLFVPFERLGADGRGIEGTGLGLVLTRGLLEAMGGTIEVRSVPGQGSTFSFELPAAEDTAADAVAAPPTTPMAPSDAAASLLYVEDNVANQRLVEQALRHRPNVQLLSAAEGAAGLRLAFDHPPDVVLLDVHLPDLPGHVVLQRLRADPRTAAVPVVVVSADATEEQMRRFRDIGCDGYLTKPLDLLQLLEVLDHLLAERDGGVDG